MIIMVVVAVVLLVLHWGGRNAVWGGATLGAIAGLIIALITGDWSLLATSFAVGTFVGTFFEWVGRLAVALKPARSPGLPSRETPVELDFLQVEKEGTTYDNLEYNYSFSYPSSWSVEDISAGLSVSAYAPSKLAEFCVYVLDHDKSPENEISSYLEEVKQSFKLTLLTNPKSFKFQGYPACEVKYSLSGTTSAGEAIQRTDTRICVTRGSHMYTIVLFVRQGGDQYTEEMDAVHRSFKFTK